VTSGVVLRQAAFDAVLPAVRRYLVRPEKASNGTGLTGCSEAVWLKRPPVAVWSTDVRRSKWISPTLGLVLYPICRKSHWSSKNRKGGKKTRHTGASAWEIAVFPCVSGKGRRNTYSGSTSL